jgi:hypothetical protein
MYTNAQAIRAMNQKIMKGNNVGHALSSSFSHIIKEPQIRIMSIKIIIIMNKA